MNKIRKQFPLLQTKDNCSLVYLDSAATALKPKAVIDALCDYNSHYSANIHRGLYPLSLKATDKYEDARRVVADFIKGAPNEIIFVRGATEGINLIASTLGEKLVTKNSRIVVSEMEHHANLVPWQMLAKKHGAELTPLPVKNYQFDLDNLKTVVNRKTKIVAVTLASNVLGVVNDLRPIIQRAHEVGAVVVVDAAQAVAHIPLDVNKLGADFVVFSGHKLYGPTGIGVVWGKTKWLEQMPPYQFGGDMIKSVTFSRSVWNDVPAKFEAGTPNISGAIGLAAAINFVKEIGFSNIKTHERGLTKYAISELQTIPQVNILGSQVSNRLGVISFMVAGIHPHDVADLLGQKGIAVRAGYHCAQPLIEKLCDQPVVRFSFGIYNTKADIDKAIEALKSIIVKLK